MDAGCRVLHPANSVQLALRRHDRRLTPAWIKEWGPGPIPYDYQLQLAAP